MINNINLIKKAFALMKSLSMLLPFFCFLVPLSSNGQQVLTLEEAVSRAQNNNLQVKQAMLQAALSEEDVRQAKMDFYPTLNASADGNLRWGKSFDQLTGSLITKSINSLNGNVNTSVPVFQGFQRVNQVAQNKYLLLANQSNIERIKNDLILSVVVTYLEA